MFTEGGKEEITKELRQIHDLDMPYLKCKRSYSRAEEKGCTFTPRKEIKQ